MQILTNHTSCAANSSFSRLGPSRVTFPSTPLQNSMKAIGYTYVASASAPRANTKIPFLSHNQLETWYHAAFWRECMKSGDRRARLEAKLGIPRCEMSAIACNIEFDFVVCFQYFTGFCVARKLNHGYEPFTCGVGKKIWKRTEAPDTEILCPTRITPRRAARASTPSTRVRKRYQPSVSSKAG
jgi:hypothetical protein